MEMRWPLGAFSPSRDTRGTTTSVSDSELAGGRRPSRAFRAGRIVARRRAGTELQHPYATSSRSKANGAVSSRSPKARRSRPIEWLSAWHRHIGARNGVVPAIVVGRFADGETAFIAAARDRAAALGRGGCAGSARNFAITTRRYWRAIFPSASRRDASSRCGGSCAATAVRSAVALRLDRVREDAANGRRPDQSVRLSCRHAQCQQRAYHAVGRRLGDVLSRQALVGDAPARPRQAQAHGGVRRNSLPHRGEPDDVRRHARNLWQQKKRIFARKGIGDIFARPGYREFFADFASNPDTRHLAHVSRVDVGATCAAANFAIVFGDCYYHVLSSYCDGRIDPLRSRHAAPARASGARDRARLRLFDFTIGDEQYKLEWSDIRLKLYDYSTAATWRGWPASVASIARRRLKRFIKQTPVMWHLVCRLRSAVGPMLASASGAPVRNWPDWSRPMRLALHFRHPRQSRGAGGDVLRYRRSSDRPHRLPRRYRRLQ